MTVDIGDIAGLVTAGAGVVAAFLSQGPVGRTLTYNRLDQLLDMRAKAPDSLSGVHAMIDTEIVRICDKLRSARVATRIAANASAAATHRLKFDWPGSLMLLARAAIIGTGGAIFASLNGLFPLVVGIVLMSLAGGLLIDEAVRTYRWLRARPRTYGERNGQGSGDVCAAQPTGAPLARSEGLDSGAEPDLAGAQVVDRGGEL